MLYSAALRQGDPDWLNFVNTTWNVAMFGHQNAIFDQAIADFFGLEAAGARARAAAVLMRRGRAHGRCGRSRRMTYHVNFNFIWKYFDKLSWGLVLSLELAVVCIAIGILIGLALARCSTSTAPRRLRPLVTAYVEFIRNVPLLLLVYLVFYGVPSVGGFKYGADRHPSSSRSRSMPAPTWSRCSAPGLDAVPRGLIDAGKAIGLTPFQRLIHVRLPTMFRVVLPSLSNTFVSLFKDTSVASVIAVPELTYGAQWINFNTFRFVEVYAVVTPMYLVTGYAILFLLRLLERRYAIGR